MKGKWSHTPPTEVGLYPIRYPHSFENEYTYSFLRIIIFEDELWWEDTYEGHDHCSERLSPKPDDTEWYYEPIQED